MGCAAMLLDCDNGDAADALWRNAEISEGTRGITLNVPCITLSDRAELTVPWKDRET